MLQEQSEHAAAASDMPWGMLAAVAAVAVGLIAAFAVASGLVGRSLTEPDAESTEDLVVAGIGQGRAGVPKWLYAAYVIIPVWALFYLVNNVQVHKETVPAAAGGHAEASPTPKPSPTPPTGASQTITAEKVQFDKAELLLKADVENILVLDNKEAVEHNVAIAKDASYSPKAFEGALFAGPAKREYKIKLPAGDYVFRCDIHVTMKGTVKAV